MTDDRISAELAGLAAKVDGLAELISQQMATLDRDLNRVQVEKDRDHTALHRRIDRLTEVVDGLEHLRQRIIGGALVVGVTTGVVGGTAGAWIVRLAEGA